MEHVLVLLAIEGCRLMTAYMWQDGDVPKSMFLRAISRCVPGTVFSSYFYKEASLGLAYHDRADTDTNSVACVDLQSPGSAAYPVALLLSARGLGSPKTMDVEAPRLEHALYLTATF
jgi:hypothetical protein